MCRTSVIKKKIGTWSKKQWIRKIKNREVFEGQPGVFGIRNNLTKIYIEKKLRSDPVAAFSAVAVSFLVFPLSFADSAARKRMFVSINVGLQQVGLQHAGIFSVLYGGPKRTCHIFFLSRDKWETCWVALCCHALCFRGRDDNGCNSWKVLSQSRNLQTYNVIRENRWSTLVLRHLGPSPKVSLKITQTKVYCTGSQSYVS